MTIDDNLLLKFDESTLAQANIDNVPIIEIKTHASKSFQNFTLFVRTFIVSLDLIYISAFLGIVFTTSDDFWSIHHYLWKKIKQMIDTCY